MAPIFLVGHEGTHLDDVATGRSSRISDYESEFSANYVQSILGEAYVLESRGGLGDTRTWGPLTGFRWGDSL